MNVKTALSIVTLATGLFIANCQVNAADIISKSTTEKTPLPVTGSEELTILQADVTPGTWKITAKANPVSWASDYFRCVIRYSGNLIDVSTAMIVPTADRIGVATVTNLAVLTSKQKGTVLFNCVHDSDLTGSPYLDPNAQLIVERVSYRKHQDRGEHNDR